MTGSTLYVRKVGFPDVGVRAGAMYETMFAVAAEGDAGVEYAISNSS